MRAALVAAVLAMGLGLLTGPHGASAAGSIIAPNSTVWQGIAFITAASGPSCASGNITIGTNYGIVYRPILTAIRQAGPEGLTFNTGRTSALFETTAATKSFRGTGFFTSATIHSWATPAAPRRSMPR